MLIDVPPIETKSLCLRQFTLEDAPKVLAMSQETGMRLWLPDQVYSDQAHATEALRKLIEQYQSTAPLTKRPLVLGICQRDDGELIGHVGLSPFPDGVEIGYAIEEAYQGKGLASEAVAAIADWAIETVRVPCIFAIVAADNAASCSVLEKAGFLLLDESTRPLHGTTRLVRTYRRANKRL
ncbi:MAG: GNAT family N-acetyltransferase [Deltaproteobacteria bacterium]|nr:GNAT family N-acetyltransferase [Deltaproteobacteria bacterium]